MVTDIDRIESLCYDLIQFRERILNEVPDFSCYDPFLVIHGAQLRSALLNLYNDLNKILVDYDC